MNDMTAGPQMRPVFERTFRTHDGVDLFYRHWPAVHGPARGAILLFHRGHEHSARMAHLVDELVLPEFDFFAWDARGHGRSPGARGDSPSFGTSVRDVQTFVDHIGEWHGVAPEDIGIVAQSVGAVIVATWVHDYAPGIRGMVLASPAFRVKLYVPLALPGLRFMRKLRGNFFVTSYVKAKFLTHDPARIASYATDPLLSRAISVNVLLGLQEAADRVVADAQAITVPTQLLISGDDWVVHHGPQHAFFDRLGAKEKERHVLHGFLHDTLGERDRAHAVDRARAFLVRVFAMRRVRPNLTEADRYGPTREEADALAAPLSPLSPRGMYWAATRASLRLGGLLADGVRLGRATGFDSGSTLDYIYRNQAKGRTLVGRLIDRNYLDAIGWRGIRQRKLDVEALLREAMEQLRASGARVHIIDVAAGHGRYVLDAVAALAERPDSILLRDYSALNVKQGTALIRERGLGTIAQFAHGDAFDRGKPGGAHAAAHAGRRFGSLRARARQRSGAPVARWSRRRDRARRLPRLYGAAVAPAARIDCPRPHQPPPGGGMGDAPTHAGRVGSARGRRRVSQGGTAHRRIGHLHRVASATCYWMSAPEAHVRSPPPEGAKASLGAAQREAWAPEAHVRSPPPEEAKASFGTAQREAWAPGAHVRSPPPEEAKASLGAAQREAWAPEVAAASVGMRQPWLWRRALAWLAFLGPFFFLSYGLANWSAAQRADVPSLAFAWETGIPFLAWTILPYWSIDLLYGLSLFLSTTRHELDTHAKRLLTAQLVAVACFVLVPLRFSFDRPAADGLWGLMFGALAGFDQPFNQLPSLHIALAVILWALYARKLTGMARLALDAGFMLICGSVLTTYQHHFIDIPTGFLLGVLCVWAWPFADEGAGRSIAAQWRLTRNPMRWRLAALYALGAVLLGTVALFIGGWALWLLWGSVSLFLVALAYAAMGVGAFQKNADGRHSLAARWLLAPYLAGAWLNSRAWTWRDKVPVAVADGVFLGRVPTARELAASPFAGVVDMTAELELRTGPCALVVVPVLDLTTPSAAALAEAAQAIERLRERGPVLVCCALGCSRSACAVAAWLLATGRAPDVGAALATVRVARSIAVLDAGHVAALGGLVAAHATPVPHPRGGAGGGRG